MKVVPKMSNKGIGPIKVKVYRKETGNIPSSKNKNTPIPKITLGFISNFLKMRKNQNQKLLKKRTRKIKIYFLSLKLFHIQIRTEIQQKVFK